MWSFARPEANQCAKLNLHSYSSVPEMDAQVNVLGHSGHLSIYLGIFLYFKGLILILQRNIFQYLNMYLKMELAPISAF